MTCSHPFMCVCVCVNSNKYMSWVQPAETALHTYDTTWNEDFAVLEQLRSSCCKRADCVCVHPPSKGWYRIGSTHNS